VHGYGSPRQQQQQPADSSAGDQQQQQAQEGAQAAAAAAGASGRSLGPSQAAGAAAAAAAAAAGDVPRVKGSGPQLDMMTGRAGFDTGGATKGCKGVSSKQWELGGSGVVRCPVCAACLWAQLLGALGNRPN
jgi:hypothetical protein